jgi:hypothetical protein
VTTSDILPTASGERDGHDHLFEAEVHVCRVQMLRDKMIDTY